MLAKKKRAPAVLAHRTGASKKYFRSNCTTELKKKQAIKETVHEIMALIIIIPVMAGLFWIMWTLKGVL